jgi:hypothetical protein
MLQQIGNRIEEEATDQYEVHTACSSARLHAGQILNVMVVDHPGTLLVVNVMCRSTVFSHYARVLRWNSAPPRRNASPSPTAAFASYGLQSSRITSACSGGISSSPLLSECWRTPWDVLDICDRK